MNTKVMNPQLVEEVIGWLSRILHKRIDENNLDASLSDEYEATSMDLVDIVESIESKYGLVVKNEEIQNIKTINDILNMITTKIY